MLLERKEGSLILVLSEKLSMYTRVSSLLLFSFLGKEFPSKEGIWEGILGSDLDGLLFLQVYYYHYIFIQ